MVFSLILVALSLGALVVQSWAESRCDAARTSAGPRAGWVAPASWASLVLTVVGLGYSAGRLGLAPDSPNFFQTAIIVTIVALVALGLGAASAAATVRGLERSAETRTLVLAAWASDALLIVSAWADLDRFLA